MRTKLTGGSELTMSSQEAQQVLDLINRHQQEMETLRSRTTVQDLAEATSLPPSEIEALLAHVRHSTAPAFQPAKKVRRYPVLIGIASLVWIAILAGAFSFTYRLGVTRGFNQERMSMIQQSGIVHLSKDRIVVNASPIAAQDLPPEVTVSFDSYTVKGENNKLDINEGSLAAAFDTIVSDRLAKRVDSDNYQPYSYEQGQKLKEALRTGDTKGLESILKFEQIDVTVYGVPMSAKVPTSPMRYGPNDYEIERERDRRLELLANKVYQVLKNPIKG